MVERSCVVVLAECPVSDRRLLACAGALSPIGDRFDPGNANRRIAAGQRRSPAAKPGMAENTMLPVGDARTELRSGQFHAICQFFNVLSTWARCLHSLVRSSCLESTRGIKVYVRPVGPKFRPAGSNVCRVRTSEQTDNPVDLASSSTTALIYHGVPRILGEQRLCFSRCSDSNQVVVPNLLAYPQVF